MVYYQSQVKLKRVHNRIGVIEGRMFGARLAIGEIVVFLDSHCECRNHWLEPMVDVIQKDRHTVAIPILDVIDPYTLKYTAVKSVPIGGFSWY